MPGLRFRDKSGKSYPLYVQETVGTLFSHIFRRNTNMLNHNVITNSAEYGLIPQREFFDKDIAVEGNTEKYYIIEQGDFVYNPRKSTTAPYGPFNCYQDDEEGIVSPLYTCLKPLHSEYTNYLLWYFRSSAWYSYIYHNGAQGGARHDRVGMTNELMDGIPVNLPCLAEQAKVSRFLSLVEDRIEKQCQLVEALKLYKRGVLCKIFSNIESKVPLYTISKYCSSSNTMAGIESNEHGNYPVYDAGGIVTYINKFEFGSPYVAIIKDGSGVGRLQLCQSNSSLIGTLGAIFPINCTVDYLHAVLQTIDFRQFTTGMAIPHIYYKDYKNVLVPFSTKQKQHCIEVISLKLDIALKRQQDLLNLLETQRKGLLQQLFI